MKTIEAIGSAAKSRYGHVPGNAYHDVDVTITRRSNGRWRCRILEHWGSAQGYDEEHGRNTVIGRSDDLDGAVSDAREQAKDGDLDMALVTRALSEAADAAEEAECDD